MFCERQQFGLSGHKADTEYEAGTRQSTDVGHYFALNVSLPRHRTWTSRPVAARYHLDKRTFPGKR